MSAPAQKAEGFDPNLAAISYAARKVVNRVSDVIVGMDVYARRKLLAEFQLWVGERLEALDKTIEAEEAKDSLIIRPETPKLIIP